VADFSSSQYSLIYGPAKQQWVCILICLALYSTSSTVNLIVSSTSKHVY
jgi:hypothetical protein